jgi:hypothetical protein
VYGAAAIFLQWIFMKDRLAKVLKMLKIIKK